MKDYKSRKWLLTCFSLLTLMGLLLFNKLNGDQFVDAYCWVLAAYLAANVGYNFTRK